MTAIHFASQFFRISYQTIEVARQNQPAKTLSERIEQTMKTHIAFLDICSTIGLPFSVTYFRIAAILQGLYRWQNDSTADTAAIRRDILFNILVINALVFETKGRNATDPNLQTFFMGLSLGLSLGDSFLRANHIFLNRLAITDELKKVYQQGFLPLMKNTGKMISSAASYTTRISLAALGALALFSKGVEPLKNLGLPLESIHELIGWTAMTGTLALFISMGVHKIFNDMGLQPSPRRRIAEISISTVSAVTVMAAAATALERVIISQYFQPIRSTVFTLGLACTLTFVFKQAISQLCDILQVQKGFLRDFEEWSFTVIGACSATLLIAPGLGIVSTIGEAALRLLAFPIMGAGLTILIGSSLLIAGKVVVLGPPSWMELSDWFEIFLRVV